MSAQFDHLDLVMLGELKEVMEEGFALLIETFIEDSEKHINNIASALASHDGESVRRAAHSLKGSASNIGALQLTDSCRSLEQKSHQQELDSAAALFSAIKEERQEVCRQLKILVANG